jgi:hypothetical protein
MKSLSPPFVIGIVLTNAGLLAALLFGPNSGRPNSAASYAGLAVVAIGLILMAVSAVKRRQKISSARVNR